MAIDPINSSSNALSTFTSASGGSAVNKDEFLKMLVAQLEHQNPLDPQDGAAFVSQLAQFSTLEQSTQTNQTLSAIQSGQDSMSRAGLTSLVGRNVTATADKFAVIDGGGAPPNLTVNLSGAATKSQVIIRDAAGNAVRTLDLGARPAGNAQAVWPPGTTLPPGNYTVEVSATNAAGAAVTGTSQLTGHVDALDFSSGSPRLRVGQVMLTPANVLSILQ